MAESLEGRQLLTVPSFGWTLNTAGVKPVVWLDGGTWGVSNASAFNAENLNNASGFFAAGKGLDGSSRNTYGPSTGMPADGNYEFTMPASAFTSGSATDVQGIDFFVAGDFNHDRDVGFADLVIYSQNHNLSGSKSFATGDADGDGDTDTDDYAILTARYGAHLAPAPSYEGEVTVSAEPVQTDGTTPLTINWGTISDATVQASDPSNASKTVAGYTIYRSTDSMTFTQIADVSRITSSEPSVYGYTDPTPVDGTKYWYRIRPFYEVTQPDGSSGFQHLPTTNKAWRVSAIVAPDFVDATIGDDQMFISWNDTSANETGYTIDVNYESDLSAGTLNLTAPANATSVSVDLSSLGSSSGFLFEVVVKAVQTDLGIESAPAIVTPTELASASNFTTDLSRRVPIEPSDTSYLYDIGTSHAFQTIEVADADVVAPWNSHLAAGTYELDAYGRVAIPTNPSSPFFPTRSTVLIGIAQDMAVVIANFEEAATQPSGSPWKPKDNDRNPFDPNPGDGLDGSGYIIPPGLAESLPNFPSGETIVVSVPDGLDIPVAPDGHIVHIPAGSNILILHQEDTDFRIIIGIVTPTPPPG